MITGLSSPENFGGWFFLFILGLVILSIALPIFMLLKKCPGQKPYAVGHSLEGGNLVMYSE